LRLCRLAKRAIRIWAHYSAQLLDQYREQYGPAESHHTDDATGNPSP